MERKGNTVDAMRTTALSLREADSLFRPYHGRKLRLATRLVMAPMPRFLARDGVPTPEMLLYYRRRAEHLLGLIITEPVAVDDPAAAGDAGMAHFYGGAALRAWKGICRAVHATPCRIIPQLDHVGMLRPFSGDMPNPDAPPIGPSGINPLEPDTRGETMSRSRIQAVVSAFADAARLSRLLGFDGVEINGARAGLVEQFLRPETNLRTDEYGGDIVGRARFACQIVSAVRKVTGRSYPVVFRLSQSGAGIWGKPLVSTPQELDSLLQLLCSAGVDIFSCDGVSHAAFAGSPLNLPGWIRLLTRRPVIANGGIGLPGMGLDSLLRRLRAREFDMVAVGRALLADAEWAVKVRMAREADIIPYSPKSGFHLY